RRRIEASKHPPTARLPRDRGCCGISIAACGCRGLRAVATGAAVDVADEHSAFLINRHVKEVEQVAANVGAAVGPNVSALHRSIRRGVTSRPGQSAIERVRDVEMPDAIEAAGIGVAGRRRAIECYGSTTCITRHRGWESYVL